MMSNQILHIHDMNSKFEVAKCPFTNENCRDSCPALFPYPNDSKDGRIDEEGKRFVCSLLYLDTSNGYTKERSHRMLYR